MVRLNAAFPRSIMRTEVRIVSLRPVDQIARLAVSFLQVNTLQGATLSRAIGYRHGYVPKLQSYWLPQVGMRVVTTMAGCLVVGAIDNVRA